MHFDVDPDFPDRVMGFAVFRPYPWHLAGFFQTGIEASKLRAELGDQYFVRHGSKHVATGDFRWWHEENDGNGDSNWE